MKLLFDQNLAPRLVTKLSEFFPGSKHVQDIGLGRASDDQVWAYALENKFTIISKDTDFSDRVEVSGFPPIPRFKSSAIWYSRETRYYPSSLWNRQVSECCKTYETRDKIIWIRKENCSTTAIELILKENFSDIKRFEQDLDRGVLILF